MRILMLSRDLAPEATTARAKRVRLLADGLVGAGHDVHLISAGQSSAPGETKENGLHLIRAGEYPPMIDTSDRISWGLQFNAAVLERATRVFLEHDLDVLHAHDWEVAWSAAAIKSIKRLPLVSTIHSRAHRREDRLIAQATWWLTYESRRTIALTAQIRAEIEQAFELPPAKQDVINYRLTAASLASKHAGVYERAISEEAPDERPSLRVVLDRSPLFAGRDPA